MQTLTENKNMSYLLGGNYGEFVPFYSVPYWNGYYQ